MRVYCKSSLAQNLVSVADTLLPSSHLTRRGYRFCFTAEAPGTQSGWHNSDSRQPKCRAEAHTSHGPSGVHVETKVAPDVPTSGREAHVSSLAHLPHGGGVHSHPFCGEQEVTASACCCPGTTGVCLQKITSSIFWKDGSAGKALAARN